MSHLSDFPHSHHNYTDHFVWVLITPEPHFVDHPCGLCSLLPNLIRDFGWNPGDRYFEWLGDIIERKTGNRDLTFKQVSFTQTL